MLGVDVNESDFVANLGIKVCDMAMVMHWCIGALVHWCIGALVVGFVMKNLKILGQKQIVPMSIQAILSVKTLGTPRK